MDPNSNVRVFRKCPPPPLPPSISISLHLSPQPPSKPWSLQMPLVSPAGPGGSSSPDGSSSISKGHGESSPTSGGTLGLPQPTICVPAPPISCGPFAMGGCFSKPKPGTSLFLPHPPPSLSSPLSLPPSLLQPPSSSPSPLCLRSRSGWAGRLLRMLIPCRQEGAGGQEPSLGPPPMGPLLYLGLWVLLGEIAAEPLSESRI